MCNEATLNRIIQTVRDLTEANAVEVLDFAEFLHARKPDPEISQGNLESHFGSLKNSPIFQGRDPVEVQREMRDAWR
jgi:hypothetical protein